MHRKNTTKSRYTCGYTVAEVHDHFDILRPQLVHGLCRIRDRRELRAVEVYLTAAHPQQDEGEKRTAHQTNGHDDVCRLYWWGGARGWEKGGATLRSAAIPVHRPQCCHCWHTLCVASELMMEGANDFFVHLLLPLIVSYSWSSYFITACIYAG